MRQKARVDKKRRLVCIFNHSLCCLSVYKINKNGTVNKRVAPEIRFTDDVDEAFRTMPYPRAGFKTVPGVYSFDYDSWNEFIEAVWREGETKLK
jgi:hypothetical protein